MPFVSLTGGDESAAESCLPHAKPGIEEGRSSRGYFLSSRAEGLGDQSVSYPGPQTGENQARHRGSISQWDPRKPLSHFAPPPAGFLMAVAETTAPDPEPSFGASQRKSCVRLSGVGSN